jgi:hypothetical protein
VKEAGRVNVVEEALDVKKDGRCNVTEADGGLGKVCQMCGAIHCRAVVPAAELERAKEVERVEIGHEMFGHDLF